MWSLVELKSSSLFTDGRQSHRSKQLKNVHKSQFERIFSSCLLCLSVKNEDQHLSLSSKVFCFLYILWKSYHEKLIQINKFLVLNKNMSTIRIYLLVCNLVIYFIIVTVLYSYTAWALPWAMQINKNLTCNERMKEWDIHPSE